MSDKPKDQPKDPFEGKNPTDPKGLNPPPAPPRSTDVDPPAVAVTFKAPHLSYNIGETASFAPDVAKELVASGVAEGGGGGRAEPQARHDPPPPASKAR